MESGCGVSVGARQMALAGGIVRGRIIAVGDPMVLFEPIAQVD
jgi:hypothetical protein